MTTISINERFNIQFICSLDEHESTLIGLRKLGFDKAICEDLTKDNCGKYYPFSEQRKEVLFTIPDLDIKRAAFVRELLNYL